MKFVLYCESDLDNVNEIVKEVESTHKITVKNVYVSVDSVVDKLNNKDTDNETPVQYNNTAAARKPHIAYSSNENRGWEEYDNISNMPTL